jgi:hypothetical protein
VSAAVGEVLSTDKAVIVATDTVITVTNNITTDTIAEKINEAHRLARQGAETAVQHAVRCGQLLIEQKKAMKHGEFTGWVVAHCEFAYSTAARYMKAAIQISTGVEIHSLASVFRSEPSSSALPSMSAPTVRLSSKDLKDLRVHGELREHWKAVEAAGKAVKNAQRALRRAREGAFTQRASARRALDAFREQQAKVTPPAEAATP